MTKFSTRISRELATEYGEEAVRIIDSGTYRAPSGRQVSVADEVRQARQGTVSYPPGVSLPDTRTGSHDQAVSVVNDTTLAAARQMLEDGLNPVALNFASATQPGGGFLSGARAQEEYLSRSSGLYTCLRDNPMYDFHRARYDPFYTDYVIYSPGVPVFRADDGVLVEAPYTLAIVTSPAVLAKRVAAERQAEIGPAMWTRILKILSAGLIHRHDSIVLGAWGCGAFGNDGKEIARLFRTALDENFRGAYRVVVFAIVDWSEEEKFIGPFKIAFKA